MSPEIPQMLAQTLPTIHVLAMLSGVALLAWILLEGFETLVLPRRVERQVRFTRYFYRNLWKLWRYIRTKLLPSQRENFLSAFGPLSLIMLLTCWGLGLVTGFGMLYWGMKLAINLPSGDTRTHVDTYLYFSGVTFITLGYGDVSPKFPLGRSLATLEAGLGFGFLAIVISYLPILYGAFSKREAKIALLDARASSPPSAGELLRRHKNNIPELIVFLREWEIWAAELLESHLSYPVLAYYRSQHDQQSWLNALTTILDTCAFIIAAHEDEDDSDPLLWQARVTFAMARHAAVDIAIVFAVEPKKLSLQRLTDGEVIKLNNILTGSGLKLPRTPPERDRLHELRGFYEPYVYVLSRLLLMPLPGYLSDDAQLDNWKTSSWDKSDQFFYDGNN